MRKKHGNIGTLIAIKGTSLVIVPCLSMKLRVNALQLLCRRAGCPRFPVPDPNYSLARLMLTRINC